ncbi:TPA: response regulator transcription factor [Salmonella enterica subsp. enterica serovar Oranienburg]|uniref:Response regulator n=1 Tax=Salmonella enterica TaxID=28901 RepID=A0A633M720_SALER|nr:response regulator transcription factor [Salmonella enterica]EAB8939538.1 DNA-binding response regulator [Salmonella enterica subsp. enterica serovar Bonariensis]ECZ9708874.1 response regulator transcription factor [Salmonella enterica subsp. enterica serovar Othmarschen]EDR6117259.1 response regulator transcription factor [Salmonella enterica subsp. enterica]EDX8939193.1 response regulator transcription factor [Salmonella enterica subsp. enterica serovar Aba]EAB9991288.1 DNA-binding respon
MQVIMFDRQSIFIHGMKISLQQHIPGISIQNVGQAEELWQKIESAPDALVMLDSGLDAEFCREVLQRIAQQFPEVKIIITAMDGSQKWLHEVMQFNVQAVVPRDSDAETFVLALNAVARGMMFLPGDWLNSTELESRDIKALSARQREILQMLAAGESNKQIGRALNISTGTVKAHLESLYRRLDVKNRTQAAMMLNESN